MKAFTITKVRAEGWHHNCGPPAISLIIWSVEQGDSTVYRSLIKEVVRDESQDYVTRVE